MASNNKLRDQLRRPAPSSHHIDWVDIIKENEHKLSAWEIDFVESVELQLKANRQLSEKQVEILERIYVKV